jgi:phage minor structural protein
MYNTGKRYNSGCFYNQPYPRPWYSYLAFALPIVMDEELRQLAILDKAYNIVSEECLDGEHKLTFNMLPDDPKLESIAERVLLDLAGIHFRIIRITYKEDDSGTSYYEIEAWARWFELTQAPEINERTFTQGSIPEILDYMLPGTGWSKGIIISLTPELQQTTRRDFTVSAGCNRLADLRSIATVFGVDLVFDTIGRKVNYFPRSNAATELFFLKGKNLKSLEIENDSTELTHRIYPYGNGGIGIESVNNGIPYLEVSSPYNPPLCAVLKDDRFTDPESLKEFAQKYLDEYSKALKHFAVKIVDLYSLETSSGYIEGKLQVGRVINIYTKEIGEILKLRIVRLKYIPEEPWNSEVELESLAKDLSSLLGRTFETTGPGELDISQLMVFNYLLNSRADDGFAYWQNDGWEVDNEEGFSGPASFKAEGGLGVSKVLKQTVYPAHREHYVLSFRCGKSDITLGENGKVGVEIIVTYEDDSTEVIFIPLV